MEDYTEPNDNFVDEFTLSDEDPGYIDEIF